MQNIEISCPEKTASFVASEAKKNNCTVNEYILSLVEQDQMLKSPELAKYIRLIEEDMKRGNVCTKSLDEIFDEIKGKLA